MFVLVLIPEEYQLVRRQWCQAPSTTNTKRNAMRELFILAILSPSWSRCSHFSVHMSVRSQFKCLTDVSAGDIDLKSSKL